MFPKKSVIYATLCEILLWRIHSENLSQETLSEIPELHSDYLKLLIHLQNQKQQTFSDDWASGFAVVEKGLFRKFPDFFDEINSEQFSRAFKAYPGILFLFLE